MARPEKVGLDYFPFDVDFFEDDKLKFVEARFNEKGELIAVKLLCKIYKAGYFIKWDEDIALLFSSTAGKNITPGLVNDVVNELIKRDFFDKNLFERFNILTSKGIQKRYLHICKLAQRKNTKILDEYLINELTHEETKLTHEETRQNSRESTQSKVKESKVNKENIKEKFSEDEKTRFKNFQAWVEENSPRINKLKKPLTIADYLKLRKKISSDTLTKICLAMENKADLLKKYTSAYLTILNWAGRRDEPTKQPVVQMDEVAKKIFKLNS